MNGSKNCLNGGREGWSSSIRRRTCTSRLSSNSIYFNKFSFKGFATPNKAFLTSKSTTLWSFLPSSFDFKTVMKGAEVLYLFLQEIGLLTEESYDFFQGRERNMSTFLLSSIRRRATSHYK